MKNILNTKTDGTPALLSNVDESGNSLIVNGTEISSSSWIGEGTYTFTVGSHTYTISKAPDNEGNYQLLKVSDYTYQFVKIVSKSIREEIEDIETALSALDTTVGGLSSDITSLQNNKVSKSGDTMTGVLDWTAGRPRVISAGTAYMDCKNSVYTSDKTSTNSTGGAARTIGGFYCRGKDDANIGVMNTEMAPTGNNYLQLVAFNKKTNGDSVTNCFRVFANKDGTATYGMSSPANFRSALGLGTLATMSNCNGVTSNGGGGKTAGFLVHGVGTGHDYALEWASSQLKFWVDKTNVGSLSDRRLKSEIQDVDMRLVKAIGECKTYQYKAFNRGGNISVGIMAQELVEKCKKYGVEPMDYELLSQMEFKEDDKTLYYHIEYEQYLVFRCLYLENKMAEMESRLSAIEAKLSSVCS